MCLHFADWLLEGSHANNGITVCSNLNGFKVGIFGSRPTSTRVWFISSNILILSVIRGRDLARTRPACLLDRQFPEKLLCGQAKVSMKKFQF